MPTDQQRAEEKIKEAERVVGDATARASSFLVRALARAREEIEDVWAEARTRSQG